MNERCSHLRDGSDSIADCAISDRVEQLLQRSNSQSDIKSAEIWISSKGPLKGGLKMAAAGVRFGGRRRKGKPDFLPLLFPLRLPSNFFFIAPLSLARTLPSGNLCVARAECAKSVKPRPSHVPTCRAQGDPVSLGNLHIRGKNWLFRRHSTSKTQCNDGFVFTRHPVSNPSSTTPAGNYGNLQLAVATAMALTLHFTMHKEEIRQVQEASKRPACYEHHPRPE